MCHDVGLRSCGRLSRSCCLIHQLGMTRPKTKRPTFITSSEFLKRFNTWAVSTGRTQQMGTNEIADFVRPYEPFGLPKKRRAAGQTFLPDLTRLRDRFVLEMPSCSFRILGLRIRRGDMSVLYDIRNCMSTCVGIQRTTYIGFTYSVSD